MDISSLHLREEVEAEDSFASKYQESASSLSDTPPQPISLYSQYVIALSKEQNLISLVQSSADGLDLQDLFGRLRIWAGNHGLHRPLHDHLSLDHQLRLAPELQQEVSQQLGEMIQALGDGEFAFHLLVPLSNIL